MNTAANNVVCCLLVVSTIPGGASLFGDYDKSAAVYSQSTFRLTADIDLAGCSILPIGVAKEFVVEGAIRWPERILPARSTVAAIRLRIITQPFRYQPGANLIVITTGGVHRAFGRCCLGEDPELETACRGEWRCVRRSIGRLCRRSDNHQQLPGHGFGDGEQFELDGVEHQRTRRSDHGRGPCVLALAVPKSGYAAWATAYRSLLRRCRSISMG